MNSFEKLQENHPSFRSLNITETEETQLAPLFDNIWRGLRGHADRLAQIAAQLVNDKYSGGYRKEEVARVASESREKVKANSLLVLESLKKRLNTCGIAVATASQTEVVADPIEKLTQQLRDSEIRSDLAQMSEAECIDTLFNATKKGDSTVLGAIQRAPITKKLVPSKELEIATQDYLNKRAPVQIAELALMKDVVEKATVSMSLMDGSLGNIDLAAGIATKSAPIRAY